MSIGERDNFVYVASPVEGCISRYILGEHGDLTPTGKTKAHPGVTTMTTDRENRYLFAAGKGGGPFAAAYRIGRDGGLDLLTTVMAPAGFHYLAVDATGRFLMGASYYDNIVAVLPIGPGGFVAEEPVCVLRPGRNPHCILPDHSNRRVYAPILGSDHVAQYRFDERRGTLTPGNPPHETTPRESGPRHMVLSPDNRFAFLLTELSGEIVSFSLDRETGMLHRRHRVSILPPASGLAKGGYEAPVNSSGGANAPTPVIWTADLRITPDGRFLYASERTTSVIACLEIDRTSGRVDYRRVQASEAQPRALGMDWQGKFLAAAGEKSDTIAVYAIDPASGELTERGRGATGKKPGWVCIVAPR